jgi:hypothetical protein
MKNFMGVMRALANDRKNAKPKMRQVGTSYAQHFVRLDKDTGEPLYKSVMVRHMRPIDYSKYTGEKLRKIRKEKGVGRPPRLA